MPAKHSKMVFATDCPGLYFTARGFVFYIFLSQIRLGGYLDLRLLAALKLEYDYLILVLEQDSGNVQRALGPISQ